MEDSPSHVYWEDKLEMKKYNSNEVKNMHHDLDNDSFFDEEYITPDVQPTYWNEDDETLLNNRQDILDDNEVYTVYVNSKEEYENAIEIECSEVRECDMSNCVEEATREYDERDDGATLVYLAGMDNCDVAVQAVHDYLGCVDEQYASDGCCYEDTFYDVDVY